MSSLEVLQSCPVQRRELLSSIGGIDLSDSNMIAFYLETHLPRLPHQLAFQIQVIVREKNIFHTVIDEGASTCIMSLNLLERCWFSFNQSITQYIEMF
jgi:hypothetical protein